MSKNARDASFSEPDQQSEEIAEEKVKEVSPNKAGRGFTRRSFIARLSASGVAAASTLPLLQNLSAAQVETSPVPAAPAGEAPPVAIVLNVNGRDYNLKLEPRVRLLDTLRENLHLFGTKKGCDHGQCGACTVHMNGRRVNSCLTFAIMHQGDKITTVEGLEKNGQLHPVQAAFLEHDGFQCGYCTSGQIMSAVALLNEPCGTDDASVKECMSGNICRCGAYPNIVAAVQAARKRA